MQCDELYVSGITLSNSPQENFKFRYCQGVTIDGITIYSGVDNCNIDGIDPRDSSDIVITNSLIHSGDDCIAVKNGVKNMLVQNVTMTQGHGASIGSILAGGNVQNITFRDLDISNTANGVRIKVEAGYPSVTVSDVTFENIALSGVRNPIKIDTAYHTKPGAGVRISNVRYSNIKAHNSQSPAPLLCQPQTPCEGMLFDNVVLDVQAQCTNVKGSVEGNVAPSSLKHCVKS